MNKLLLLAICFSASFQLTAQTGPLNCGNGRYADDVFTDVIKTADVIYGYNTTRDNTTLQTFNQTLRFDFYEPAGDNAEKRPLIILAFGGGFVTGTRADMEPVCIALAKKGYATATIDYRLIHNTDANIFAVYTIPGLLPDQVVKASVDMKAAIRFFKHNAATTNTYKIDTNNIIIGGGSSGAIAALQTAYVDDVSENPATTLAYAANGGFEGNTDLPAPNSLRSMHNASGIVAVLNIAGGIADTTLIDADNPPVYSAQGDADEIVPYGYGPIRYGPLATTTLLYGASLIHERATNLGVSSELYTVAGGTHESVGMPPYINNIVTQASAFLQPIVCNTVMPVTLTSFTVQLDNCAAELRWNTATEQQSSHYDIEMSDDGSNFSKIGSVKSKNSAGATNYAYDLKGRTRAAWFRLKMVDKDGEFSYSAVQRFNSTCAPALQLYPNPARNQAFVSGLETGMQVNVINAEGKLLWARKAFSNTLQIPLTTFANGLYLIQIKDKSGRVLLNNKLLKN